MSGVPLRTAKRVTAKSPAGSVRPYRVATDPKPRDDGLCICGCGRALTKIARRHGDPFASTACCRAWYDADHVGRA